MAGRTAAPSSPVHGAPVRQRAVSDLGPGADRRAGRRRAPERSGAGGFPPPGGGGRGPRPGADRPSYDRPGGATTAGPFDTRGLVAGAGAGAGGGRVRGGGGDGRGRGPGDGRGASHGDSPRGGGEHPAKRRSFLWRWRRAFFLLALLGLTAMAAGAAVMANTELPEIKPLEQSTFICDASVPEGCNLTNAMATIQGEQDRVNIRYDQLPPVLINAVVAMEDRDFFEHRGVNPMSIGRALYRDLRGDAVQQGGSTITQQYVKNAFLTPERALTRKIKEAVLSVKLEQNMSKEEILEGYLNTIYFGRGAYGVQAAAQAYFRKDVSGLGIGESAYLAGLIRAPVLADGTRHPEEAERRRHTALVAMEEEGYITKDELTLADAQSFEEPWFVTAAERSEISSRIGKQYGNDYIVAYVNELLQQEPYNFTKEEIYGGGLRVYTSLDQGMQEAAWNAVWSNLNADPASGDPVASMVAVDDQGLIRAMVGGPGFVARTNETNYAVRGQGSDGRPVGSTFKPIALAEAVSSGYSLESTYNAPGTMTIDQEQCDDWEVSNYDESEAGTLNLVEATSQSSNTAFGQLMVDLGPEKVIDMAHKLGIAGDFGEACAPIVLGSDNATPLEMATVYSTFANQGVRKDPIIITRVEQVGQDGDVTVLHTTQPHTQQVLAAPQANLVTHALQGVIAEGTGTGADIGKPAAGKTGTSNNNTDAWFVGYVPKLTAAVWMGYPNADWDNPDTPEV